MSEIDLVTDPNHNSNSLGIHTRLQNDFTFFAKHALKIKDKGGSMVPFCLNKAQQHIHSCLQHQIEETGMVRTLLLKGRQQGGSTYTGGRYYHNMTRSQGKSVFILSHSSDTTGMLFDMVERYHDNCPEFLRPEATTKNVRKLGFSSINASYAVGTAGNADIGVGGTVQLFHGSEVSRWKNEDSLVAGIMQSISRQPGTEIIFESTAKGMANRFYAMCMEAMKGIGDYKLVFVPWYWQPEYVKEWAEEEPFKPTDEEDELQTIYKLSIPQLNWRRMKIVEHRSETLFKENYPNNPMEAFQASGDSLVDTEDIMRARRSKLQDKDAPLVIGLDPAIKGDRSVFCFRRGREIVGYKVFDEYMEPMRLAGIAAKYIDDMRPAQMFVDVGLGYGVISRLKELGYGRVVKGIHFGQSAMASDIYANKRAEMLCAVKDWFADGEVNMPDTDEFQADICCVPMYIETSSGKIQFISKARIAVTAGRSYDIMDSLALTFAFPVRNAKMRESISLSNPHGHHSSVKSLVTRGGDSPLQTLNRVRRGSQISEAKIII